jgi:glucose/arabinose dehydrogenase
MKKVLFLTCALFFLLSTALYAQPNVVFTSYVTGFSTPVKVTNANDNSNRLFVVEQGGTIRIIRNGTLQAQPFLDISAKTEANGEQGLLSVAFPPRFRQHRFFFVYYTDLNGNVTVARYQVSASNADSAVVTSEKILLNLPKPSGFTNHNGGDMHFGKDNFLYITIGDGGGGGDPFNNSQDGNSLFGKMLRLNVVKNSAPYYSVPATNPFVNDPAVRDEIYALGLRNPWRWSFDRLTGDVWIADVGQDKFEEVNYLTPTNAKGANYGWRCYEGNANYNLSGCSPSSNYDFPIFAYGHNFINGGYSITGGYVYRGTQYPSLQGYYLCADFISSNLWKIAPNGSGGWNINRQNCPNSLVSFGEDESGELYALALNGTLYKVSAAASPIAIKQSASTYQSFVFPTVVQNGQITIQTDGVSGQLHILNMNGKMVYQQPVTGTFGNLRIQLPHLTAGTYFVQLLSETSSRQQKIIIK